MASSSEEEPVEITGGPHNHTRPRVGFTPSDGRVPHNVEAARAAEVAPYNARSAVFSGGSSLTHARWQAVDNRPTMGRCTYAPWP
jgi:hypothetical protein